MQIAIPLFPRFTALDGIGPYEVLQRIPGFDVTFVGHERGEVAHRERLPRHHRSTPRSRSCRTPTSSCSPAASAPAR